MVVAVEHDEDENDEEKSEELDVVALILKLEKTVTFYYMLACVSLIVNLLFVLNYFDLLK